MKQFRKKLNSAGRLVENLVFVQFHFHHACQCLMNGLTIISFVDLIFGDVSLQTTVSILSDF